MNSTSIWDEIDLSESYLVCCMFEKAATIASSILKRILMTADSIEHIELSDMMESAGMVLVQSLKELGRSSEILKELKTLFGSVAHIPVQVLLTGVCFQISDGSHDGLCEVLDEFLGMWRYVDGQFYVLVSAEQNGAYLKGGGGHYVLEIDKYMEVVEVYALTLLGGLLNNTDLAIAWVEKAELPDGIRQDLLRRLRSLFSLKATKSARSEDSLLLANKNGADSEMESTISGAVEKSSASKVGYPSNGGDSRKQTFIKFTQGEPCFWLFRTVNLKFGNARLAISRGKIALWGSLIIFICFLLQKKRASLKQIASRQASSVKKALVDLWQLAFSVQVNPLAAIQPLPAAAAVARGSSRA